MPKTTRQRTPTEAVEELKKLHEEFKDRQEGERLTNKVIQAAVGVSQEPTVSRWLNGHHLPTGAILMNLCEFLDSAKDRKWLKRFITDHGSRK